MSALLKAANGFPELGVGHSLACLPFGLLCQTNTLEP